MKSFRIFIFLLFMAAISIAAYYFFETDINTLWCYIRTSYLSNTVKNEPTPTITNFVPQTITPIVIPSVTPSVTPTEPIFINIDPSQSTGIAQFDFIQKSSGQALPDKNVGNGYIKIEPASHSRVASKVELTPQGADSYCEYWLINKDGETVLHVKDTIGGFHPNFFEARFRQQKGNDYYKWVDDWAANFKPFGIFQNARIDRANNHFPEYNRYVLEGHYTFKYKNLSGVKQLVTAGFIRQSNGVGDVNEEVGAFDEITKDLHIFPPTDEGDSYKINTNNYSI